MSAVPRRHWRITTRLPAVAVLLASLAGASGLVPVDAWGDDALSSQALWGEAQAAELAGFERDRDDPKQAISLFQRAGELFESVALQRSEPAEVSDAYWRSARSIWLVADAMPREAKDERVRYYLRSEALADKGLEVYPECAGCMLWKFSSMGRLATTRGIWTAGRQIAVMADLLERGIGLQPTFADNENNSLLGNLHYSSAIFYRVLPDWFFMRWFFGVRGDKDRSLQHSGEALALHPGRIEYQVELGSQLLCRGSGKSDQAQLSRGREVMLNAIQRETNSLDDERELAAARVMLDEPRKSCGYSGDGWLEIDRKQARKAAGG